MYIVNLLTVPGVPAGQGVDIWHGQRPLIDSRDTVYAMRIAEAAYEAIRSDEKVISLAEVERAQIDGVTVG